MIVATNKRNIALVGDIVIFSIKSTLCTMRNLFYDGNSRWGVGSKDYLVGDE